MHRLFLFDIDGTLIDSAGAGTCAIKDAMHTCFGVEEDLQEIMIAGATDHAIVRDLLSKHGFEITSDKIATLLDTYIAHLKVRITTHQGSLLPGIRELLEHLRARPDCELALLTGNIARGAEIKLLHYGIWDYFGFGAFSDHHHDRDELARFAYTRAKEHHAKEFHEVYVLGDTPHDIKCGRFINAKTVAVATGIYSAQELATHQPDFLFQNLENVEDILVKLLP